jgi:cell volume regulation protein A
VLILISVTISKLSENLGLPSLVLFLAIGMLAGSDGPGEIYFDNFFVAQYVGIIALVFILFSGGIETRWNDVKPVMWSGIALSTVGVFITTAVMGLFIHYVFGIGLREGLLIGAVVSSTDAAAVFSVLRAKGTSLKGKLKQILEFESGSNDPAAIILTVILIEIISMNEFSIGITIVFLFMQIVIGGLIGYFAGRLMVFALNKFRFSYPSLYPVFAIAACIFIYAITASLKGSGILAVYISALVLGNSEFIQKKSLIRFFDGLALLGQIVVFLTLGLLVYPTQLYNVVGVGLIMSACLIFLARPAAVFISLIFSNFKFNEKVFISWVGLRGAVPVILATFPITAGLEIGPYIFNLVFFITITSVLIQGSSIPFVAKLLGVSGKKPEVSRIPIEMIEDVRTNNDLLDLIIPENARVVGKSLAELNLPSESLVTVIYRDNDYVVPSGSTTLEAGDTILVLVNKNNINVVKNIFTKLQKK